jgi:Leucine-rich repeat (LRR) protein
MLNVDPRSRTSAAVAIGCLLLFSGCEARPAGDLAANQEGPPPKLVQSQFPPLKIIETPEIAKLRAVGLNMPTYTYGVREFKNEEMTHVHFMHPNTLTDADVPLLLAFPNLVELHFQASNITDEGLSSIGQIKGLTKLHISVAPGVTDQGLEKLRELSNLEQLSVNGTMITDDGVAHLAGLTKLQWLSLSESGLTDDCIPHLQGFPELKNLFLEHTHISPAGKARLEQDHPGCRVHVRP